LERCGEMLGEVSRIVAAGIEMEFVGMRRAMRIFVRGRWRRRRSRSRRCHRSRNRFSGQRDSRCGPGRAGCFWSQKTGSGGLPKTPPRTRARGELEEAAEKAGKLFDERGAVGADGAEKLRVAEGEMQRAVAAHGERRRWRDWRGRERRGSAFR